MFSPADDQELQKHCPITLHYIARDGQFGVVRNSLCFCCCLKSSQLARLDVGVGSYLRVSEVSPGIITFSWYSLWATLHSARQQSIVSGQDWPGLTCQVSVGPPTPLQSGSLSFNEKYSNINWSPYTALLCLALPCSALLWLPLFVSWGSVSVHCSAQHFLPVLLSWRWDLFLDLRVKTNKEWEVER